MNDNIQIDFSLTCYGKREEQLGIYVGYIPALRVYSQGRTQEEMEKALASAAELFIVTCYERGILGQALRDRGMTRATGAHIAHKAQEEKRDYITIAEKHPSFDKPFTVKVPISLLAAQEIAA
jgi:hypothetical protein